MTSVPRICAWCKEGLSEDPRRDEGRVEGGEEATHGICRSCAVEYFGVEFPDRYRPCESCGGSDETKTRTGERMCAGLGGPYEPVFVYRDCEAPGCEDGFVRVTWDEEDYETALERPE